MAMYKRNSKGRIKEFICFQSPFTCLLTMIFLLSTICILKHCCLMDYVFSVPLVHFNYPIDYDLYDLIDRVQNNKTLPKSITRINNKRFKFTILPTTPCNLAQKLYKTKGILILVKTTSNAVASRNVIRQTWGNSNCYKQYGNSKVLFMLAIHSSQPNENTAVNEEALKYGDIIQQNFEDNYYNNTYKLMMGIDYAMMYCSHLPYVVIIDDDFFLNPQKLQTYLSNINSRIYDRFIGGYVMYTALPRRFSGSKWYVTYNEYPFTFFPEYPTGGIMIMAMPLVKDIAAAMRFVMYNRFDDVYLGIVLLKMHIAPVHIKEVYIERPYKMNQNIMASHGFSKPEALLKEWTLLNMSHKCKPK